MPRNLVICCDGTSNRFGTNNTNVVRLSQILERDSGRQQLYYDPGVGTLPEPGWVTKLGKAFSETLGLAFGAGLLAKVGEAYECLMDWWEPGDRVYLFGFSRGAYTVRVLAGLLYAAGLLPKGNHNLTPYVLRLFRGSKDRQTDAYWEVLRQFRRSFARPVHDGDGERHFPVHFLGLWDTVSSVGWVWDPVTYPYTWTNPGVKTVRHAVALDERRAFFRQNLFRASDGQDVQERWFPGVHCDIGGGYPDVDGEAGQWRESFDWVVGEAEAARLETDAARKKEFLSPPSPVKPPWAQPVHESLRGLWWLAEIFPKLRRGPDVKGWQPHLNLGRRRYVPEGAEIHAAALHRIHKGGYVPANLSPAWLARVRALSQIPDFLPYQESP
jgi:uncharacterized protein (DUF2235 family)